MRTPDSTLDPVATPGQSGHLPPASGFPEPDVEAAPRPNPNAQLGCWCTSCIATAQHPDSKLWPVCLNTPGPM